ncbi:Hypothetical protein NTJ_08355 [Nesidiocoris tenuis]|uniref:Uncharacterized protein n=1 Tax=Nesidiocoris tenuis TaxID=355587 RepID=A0ABN7ATN4_9HEMI|nr:Hypothetical protein NTJ_08355 [Nesidiocoris tenuis]
MQAVNTSGRARLRRSRAQRATFPHPDGSSRTVGEGDGDDDNKPAAPAPRRKKLPRPWIRQALFTYVRLRRRSKNISSFGSNCALRPPRAYRAIYSIFEPLDRICGRVGRSLDFFISRRCRTNS